MHSEIRAALDDAAALLRTYVIALREDGLEVVELLDAGISHRRIAALYPHSAAAWAKGAKSLVWNEPELRSIIGLDGTVEEHLMPTPKRPPALTKNGWLACRLLIRSLSPEIPYFTDELRRAYRTTGRVMSTGEDVELHLHVIIMFLHILTASPAAAAELKDRTARRYARTTLDAAAALAREPEFKALHTVALGGAA